MIVEAATFKGKMMIDQALIEYENDDDGSTHSERLESCLRTFCQQIDAPLPLWLEKNTREYVRFQQTIFFQEQFLEPVKFDRMQIRTLE